MFAYINAPGTNYCGLGQPPVGTLPLSDVDAACLEHDHGYTHWRDYFIYNTADAELIRRLDEIHRKHGLSFSMRAANVYFKLKRSIARGLGKRRTRTHEPFGPRDPLPKRRIPDLPVNLPLVAPKKARRIYRFKRDRYGRQQSFWKMPYRRRRYRKRRRRRRAYRRRYAPKRRRTYRKRYTPKRLRWNKFIDKIYSSLVPPRTYLVESNQGISWGEGRQVYWIPAVLGSTTEIEAGWGDIETGTGGTLGGNTARYAKTKLEGFKMNIRIVNPNPHPVYIQAYLCVCRRDITDDTYSSLTSIALARLATGFADKMASNDEKETADLSTDFTLESLNTALTPYMSAEFCEAFKIVSVKKGTLNPGVTANFQCKSRSMGIVSHSRIRDNKTFRGLRTYTKFYLFRITCSTGHSTNVDTVVTTLSGIMHCDIQKRYVFKYVSNHNPTIAYENQRNTTFGDDGQGGVYSGELVSHVAEATDL
jgi:hypothetical protein